MLYLWCPINSINFIIRHLRIVHSITEGKGNLKCLVSNCNRSFCTYCGLRRHVNHCKIQKYSQINILNDNVDNSNITKLNVNN